MNHSVSRFDIAPKRVIPGEDTHRYSMQPVPGLKSLIPTIHLPVNVVLPQLRDARITRDLGLREFNEQTYGELVSNRHEACEGVLGTSGTAFRAGGQWSWCEQARGEKNSSLASSRNFGAKLGQRPVQVAEGHLGTFKSRTR